MINQLETSSLRNFWPVDVINPPLGVLAVFSMVAQGGLYGRVSVGLFSDVMHHS